MSRKYKFHNPAAVYFLSWCGFAIRTSALKAENKSYLMKRILFY